MPDPIDTKAANFVTSDFVKRLEELETKIAAMTGGNGVVCKVSERNILVSYDPGEGQGVSLAGGVWQSLTYCTTAGGSEYTAEFLMKNVEEVV